MAWIQEHVNYAKAGLLIRILNDEKTETSGAQSWDITLPKRQFLGVGIGTEIPSWGNIMAEGRNFVAVAFHIILYPGLFLGVAVLAVNLVGDGLRDMLDPRLAKKL